MQRKSLFTAIVGALFIMAAVTMVYAEDSNSKIPEIPGITVKDSHPNGCVDCHRNVPNRADYRLSTKIVEWATEGADDEIMERAEAAWPEASLSGKHPNVAAMIKTQNIPTSCLTCHGEDSSKPLYRVLHTIHYTGGADNHFISSYKGFCTQCHEVNLQKPPEGTMEVKIGKEGS